MTQGRPGNGGAGYDFFLAHAGSDFRAAEELYDHLSSQTRVFLDSRCLRPGDPWDVALPKAQRRSRVTVVLVSSRTDSAWYEREEVAAAIHLARGPGGHRVVPVYLDGWPVEPGAIPYGLHRLHALVVSPQLPLKEVARQLLESALGRPSPQGAARLQPPMGLPPRPERFVSRAGPYRQLLEAVLADEPVALTGVVGAGGFGKTTRDMTRCCGCGT